MNPPISKEEADQNSIQFLYGLVLVLIAACLATVFFGNTFVITAVLCLLLIVNGVPNMMVGLKKMRGE